MATATGTALIARRSDDARLDYKFQLEFQLAMTADYKKSSYLDLNPDFVR